MCGVLSPHKPGIIDSKKHKQPWPGGHQFLAFIMGFCFSLDWSRGAALLEFIIKNMKARLN